MRTRLRDLSRPVLAGLTLLLVFGCRTDLEQDYTQEVFECEAGIARVESCCDVEVQATAVCLQTEGEGGSGCSPHDYSRRRIALSDADVACLADAACEAMRGAGLCASAPAYLASLSECDTENEICPPVDAAADPEQEQAAATAFRTDMGALCK